MWIKYLSDLDKSYNFHTPVVHYQLDEAEEKLKVKLPEELHELLHVTNGITDEYECAVMWPLSRIVEDNLHFRSASTFKSIYMPFDNLLFFADAGNGDQFGFAIRADGSIYHSHVYAWDHENDSRIWVADSLKMFFKWSCEGKLSY